MVLHICELHEVDFYGSALPYPQLSASHSLEVFTSSFNIPKNRYLMSESKQPTIHYWGPYYVSIFIHISKGNSTFVVSLFGLLHRHVPFCPLINNRDTTIVGF